MLQLQSILSVAPAVMQVCPAAASYSSAVLASLATHADCSRGAHGALHSRVLCIVLECNTLSRCTSGSDALAKSPGKDVPKHHICCTPGPLCRCRLRRQAAAVAPHLLHSRTLNSLQTPTARSCRSTTPAVLEDPHFATDSDGEELPYTEEFFLPGSGASRGLTSQDLEASRTQTWDDPVATVSIDDVDKPGALPGQMKTSSP
jgi:hypothetical protein